MNKSFVQEGEFKVNSYIINILTNFFLNKTQKTQLLNQIFRGL